MQFTKAAIVAALATAVSAGWANETWVTTTVSVLTTVCPAATTLTHNGVTYTATASQTITITNCPCTISYKPTVTPVVYCSTCPASSPAFVNSTVVATPAPTTVVPVGTVTPTTAPPKFTGAANRAVAGSAAGLAGLLGLAAYIL